MPAKISAEKEAEIVRLFDTGIGVSKVASEAGVGMATAYRVLGEQRGYKVQPYGSRTGPRPKREATVEQRVEPVSNGGSLKARIVMELYRHGGNASSIGEIQRWVARPGENVDLHNITHLLTDSLSKQQWLTYKRTGGTQRAAASVIYDIRLTSKAFRYKGDINGQPAMSYKVADKVAANAANMAAATVESPPQTAQAAPQAPEEPAVAPVPTPAPVGPHTPEYREERKQRTEAALLLNGEAAADQYPLMRALVNRGTKVVAAAKLLREAGLTDMADLAEQEGAHFTDLEKEVVEFLRRNPLPPVN